MNDKKNPDLYPESEEVVFRPASGEENSKDIKIQKIRRDDRGHILSDEPVRMPRENLYYNPDGYIPQENVNYGRKTMESPPAEVFWVGPQEGGPGQEDFYFDEEDEINGDALVGLTEDLLEERENEELAVRPDEGLFDELPEGYGRKPWPGQAADGQGGGVFWGMPEAENVMEEPQTALEEPADQDRYTKEELAESGIDDGWANSYIPPAKEERHPPGKTKGPSGILKAVLAACGVLAALLIGAFIALWDLGKNAGELRRVFTEEYTAELVEEYLNELRLSEGVSVTETVQDIAEETEEEKQEETDGAGEDTETEDPEEEYENSNMEIAGLTTLVKAGSGDEIEIEAGAPAVADGSGALSEYISPDKYYPLAYSSVGEDYFADALFVGDSRLQGFGMYSGLVSTYYCVTSFSVYKYDTMKVVQTDAGKVPIFDALPFDAFTKIYIKIGLNEMGGNEELFYQKYAELINMLRVYEPRAIVYIHAVLPVTAAKSASDKVHNNVSIYARNEQLKKFATEQRAYYVEVSEELLDEDGNLIPEATADGIHLKPKYMEPWKRKLMQQAVVLPR